MAYSNNSKESGVETNGEVVGSIAMVCKVMGTSKLNVKKPYTALRLELGS